MARGACHPTGEPPSGATWQKKTRRRAIHLHILHAFGGAASLRTGPAIGNRDTPRRVRVLERYWPEAAELSGKSG
ncbi:hypothetical protein ANTQUA_LOCUS4792 [Anthophora quadrimaculata]